jgi:hypothetical protein
MQAFPSTIQPRGFRGGDEELRRVIAALLLAALAGRQ